LKISNNVHSCDAPFRYAIGSIRGLFTENTLPKPGKLLFELKGKDQFVCRDHPLEDTNIGWDGINPCVYYMDNVIDHPSGGIKLNNFFTPTDLYPDIPQWVKDMRIGNGSELKIHQTAGAVVCKELFRPPFMVRYTTDIEYVDYLLKSVWCVNQYATEPATVEPDGFETLGYQDGIFFTLNQGGQGYKDRWMNISHLKPFRPTGLIPMALCIYPDKISWYIKGILIKEHGVLADYLYNLLITSLPQMNTTKNSSFYVKELEVFAL